MKLTPLVEVRNLNIEFQTMRGPMRAVDHLSFSISEGETLGIVGESGCGKSITSLALMGLLPSTAKVTAERFEFSGKSLVQMSDEDYRQLRGGEMAMIFQDPMTSLNPSYTVGFQIMEALRAHQQGPPQETKAKAYELLNQVGIPDVEHRFHAYPHHLSGGMSQRVMIAMAIACKPKLLIADEPTTALDVTIQAQILELLKTLQKKFGMALLLITHDLGVVAEMADRIMVMYAGQCVEMGSVSQIIESPRHPYTFGLLQSLPGAQLDLAPRSLLKSIPGMVPDLVHRPRGCQLHPRCEFAQAKCKIEVPSLQIVGRQEVKCFFPREVKA